MNLQRAFAVRCIVGLLEQVANGDQQSSDDNIPEALQQSGHPEGGGWEADRLIYLGRDSRGYAFYGYASTDSEPLVLAGCRCFTIAEARQHWGVTHRAFDSSDEAVRFVDAFESWLGLRQKPHTDGSKTATEVLASQPVVAAPDKRVVDVVLVEEFLGPVLSPMFRNWLNYHNKGYYRSID